MPTRQRERLAEGLSTLLEQARKERLLRIENDPICFPRRFQRPEDIEVVGWWAAALAYGRVEGFSAVIEKILALTDGRPYDYFLSFRPEKERPRFEGILYRFHTSDDLFRFALLTHKILARFGRIGKMFLSFYRGEEEGIGATLIRWVDAARLELTQSCGATGTHGLQHLLPSPREGSACKRLNLYLRWMIRPDDGVDFGLWPQIPTDRLVIPLDTHICRIGHLLGLTHRKTPDWKMAVEITQSLRAISPSDPVQYDFALCHLGISGACPLVGCRGKCQACPLRLACRRGRVWAR